MDIDYAAVTKYLIKYYEIYPKIHMDFNSIEGKIVVHKIRYENYNMITGQPTSYNYSDFERITKRLKQSI